MNRRAIVVAVVAWCAIGGGVACATKKQLRTSIGQVNDKVEALARSLEDTQERTRLVEVHVAQVDVTTQGVSQVAQQASVTAREASAVAALADQRGSAVDEKLAQFDTASRRLVLQVVLTQGDGNFRPGQTALPAQTRRTLDRLVQGLKAEPKNAFIEIEGYTDSRGSRLRNKRVGLERARAAQRYLYEQYHIPLHKMNVISYGEDKPIARNDTRTGRARNRRIVIRVLA